MLSSPIPFRILRNLQDEAAKREDTMKSRSLSLMIAVALLAGLLVPVRMAARTFRVLHSFTPPPDAGHPFTGLTRDAAGNFYGTTAYGGTSDSGTVFELTKQGKELVLYSFTGGADGGYPQQGQLTLDSAGNIYGVTGAGGAGAGVVFQLDTSGHERVLYSFGGGADGGFPHAGVVRDASGNLYGTTQSGGDPSCGCGVVFKLDTNNKEHVLYSFKGGADGAQPFGNLVLDGKRNVYGTTFIGGDSSCQCGVVFKVDKNGTEHVLHAFTGPDGAGSTGGLVRDRAGNLYGTTMGGGAYKEGVVFKIDPTGKESVLYSFTGGADGAAPITSVVRDPAGNLYGTTDSGGSGCFFGCGVVFKLAPNGHETVLHTFNETDGAQALDLVRDPAGNLYGTTLEGGISGCHIVFSSECGVVFKLSLRSPTSRSRRPVGTTRE
jgi:uncharacterized repeat protein (TIGR03803 family)